MSDIGQAFIAHARFLLSYDYLPKIERCLEKLSDEDLWWRPDPTSNSIGNLVLHMAGNARQWVVAGIDGESDMRERQGEFDARSMSRTDMHQALTQTIDQVDAALARATPAQLIERREIQGSQVSVLEAIVHVVEHFSMHTGQIILLTKILTKSDLRFYDFSSGTPAPTWRDRK